MFMGLLASLLPFPPVISLLIVSFVVLLTINLGYKFLIDQQQAKRTKERINDLRKKMDSAKDDKKKTAELFSEIMKENTGLMRMTFKPMLLSLLLFFLVFPLITAEYGDVVVAGNATNVTLGNAAYPVRVADNAMSAPVQCAMPCRTSVASNVWNIQRENGNIRFGRIVAFPPVPLPFVGDDLGWIGWYFLSSIPLVILLRKLLKIYV